MRRLWFVLAVALVAAGCFSPTEPPPPCVQLDSIAVTVVVPGLPPDTVSWAQVWWCPTRGSQRPEQAPPVDPVP